MKSRMTVVLERLRLLAEGVCIGRRWQVAVMRKW
jgi:hypothetical protein